MSGRLSRAAEAALGLVYPRRACCMGCGSRAGLERDWLCEDCRQALAACWLGAAPPPEGGLIEGAAYACVYSGPVNGLVRNLKYGGVARLAGPMGRRMARAFEALGPARVDLVTPVPMHVRRLRRRGFNQAGLLAREAAAGLGLPCAETLTRTRDTVQQARLDGVERLRNMEGAFAAAADVAGRRVLLVDDVCTTGATANACAAELLRAGAGAVLLLCFAKARAD